MYGIRICGNEAKLHAGYCSGHVSSTFKSTTFLDGVRFLSNIVRSFKIYTHLCLLLSKAQGE
jgi:hypothetical protein